MVEGQTDVAMMSALLRDAQNERDRLRGYLRAQQDRGDILSQQRDGLRAEVERPRRMSPEVRNIWKARAEAAEAKVARVRALHVRSDHVKGSTAAKLSEHLGVVCLHCVEPWPCPTIRAIADAPAEHTPGWPCGGQIKCPQCAAEGDGRG